MQKMTKRMLILIPILLPCISCADKSEQSEKAVENNENPILLDKQVKTPRKEVGSREPEAKKDIIPKVKKLNQVIKTQATIISVKEELIMPSDYITTAMTVRTDDNQTLVFLDMDYFEKLVNKKITIEYKLIPDKNLLLCFDCQSYSEKIKLWDITSMSSGVKFRMLKLEKYVEDDYVIPASIYHMIDKKGHKLTFNSNDNELISNRVKMKSGFFKYGMTTKVHPELQNRDELAKLLK